MSELTDRLNEVVQKAWANGWWNGRVQQDVAEAVERIEELEDDARADNALLDWHLANVDKLQARIDELEAALHIPQSCTMVKDLVDLLGERGAYTKIVADSIGHRGRIAELEAALREIERSGPLTVCHEVARRALGDNDE